MPSSPSFLRKSAQFRANGVQDRSQFRRKWILRRRIYLILLIGLVILGLIIFKGDHFPYNRGQLVRSAKNRLNAEGKVRSSDVQPRENLPAWAGGVMPEAEKASDTSGIRQELPGLEPLKVDSDNSRSRLKVLGVVGLQTDYGSVDRRTALRDTWLPSNPEDLASLQQATGLAFRFVIGRTSDLQMMAELDKEIEKYKDFIRLEVEEKYQKLAQKTLAFFKAAYMLFDADFYVKADDNIYLRPDRLATLLAKDRTSSRTYLGCMKKGPVVTNSKLKWFEPLGHLFGNEYFSHANGPIYALSAEIVASLALARNDSFRFFSNEDITIGAWMLAMNVDHEDNRALCDAECTSTSIAVWDIPKCSGLCNATEKLRKLHNMGKCSRTPTLPAGG